MLNIDDIIKPKPNLRNIVQEDKFTLKDLTQNKPLFDLGGITKPNETDIPEPMEMINIVPESQQRLQPQQQPRRQPQQQMYEQTWDSGLKLAIDENGIGIAPMGNYSTQEIPKDFQPQSNEIQPQGEQFIIPEKYNLAVTGNTIEEVNSKILKIKQAFPDVILTENEDGVINATVPDILHDKVYRYMKNMPDPETEKGIPEFSLQGQIDVSAISPELESSIKSDVIEGLPNMNPIFANMMGSSFTNQEVKDNLTSIVGGTVNTGINKWLLENIFGIKDPSQIIAKDFNASQQQKDELKQNAYDFENIFAKDGESGLFNKEVLQRRAIKSLERIRDAIGQSIETGLQGLYGSDLKGNKTSMMNNSVKFLNGITGLAFAPFTMGMELADIIPNGKLLARAYFWKPEFAMLMTQMLTANMNIEPEYKEAINTAGLLIGLEAWNRTRAKYKLPEDAEPTPEIINEVKGEIQNVTKQYFKEFTDEPSTAIKPGLEDVFFPEGSEQGTNPIKVNKKGVSFTKEGKEGIIKPIVKKTYENKDDAKYDLDIQESNKELTEKELKKKDLTPEQRKELTSKLKTIDDSIKGIYNEFPDLENVNILAKIERHKLPDNLDKAIGETAKDFKKELENSSVYVEPAFSKNINTVLLEDGTEVDKNSPYDYGVDNKVTFNGMTVNDYPDWFSQRGWNKKSVITALDKIIKDKGSDKGKLVEEVKKEIIDALQNGRDQHTKFIKGGVSSKELVYSVPKDAEISSFLENFTNKKITSKDLHKEYKRGLEQENKYYAEREKELTEAEREYYNQIAEEYGKEKQLEGNNYEDVSGFFKEQGKKQVSEQDKFVNEKIRKGDNTQATKRQEISNRLKAEEKKARQEAEYKRLFDLKKRLTNIIESDSTNERQKASARTKLEPINKKLGEVKSSLDSGDMFNKQEDIFTEKRIISEESYKQAKDNLNKGDTFNKANANDIFPKHVKDLSIIAGYHIENGVRNFRDFSKKMIDEVGEWVKPHLKDLFLRGYKDVNEYVKTKIGETESFKDAHTAPSFDSRTAREKIKDGGDFNLVEVSKGKHNQPEDYFDSRVGARYYGYNDKAGMESFTAIDNIIRAEKNGIKDRTITAYRTIPKDVNLNKLENGEWVTFSKEYAKQHGERRFGEGEYKIVKQEVKPKDVWWDGNDINEWGYDNGTGQTRKTRIEAERDFTNAYNKSEGIKQSLKQEGKNLSFNGSLLPIESLKVWENFKANKELFSEVNNRVVEIAKSTGNNFQTWARQTVKELGDWIRPHLRKLYNWITSEHAYTGSKSVGKNTLGMLGGSDFEKLPSKESFVKKLRKDNNGTLPRDWREKYNELVRANENIVKIADKKLENFQKSRVNKTIVNEGEKKGEVNISDRTIRPELQESVRKFIDENEDFILKNKRGQVTVQQTLRKAQEIAGSLTDATVESMLNEKGLVLNAERHAGVAGYIDMRLNDILKEDKDFKNNEDFIKFLTLRVKLTSVNSELGRSINISQYFPKLDIDRIKKQLEPYKEIDAEYYDKLMKQLLGIQNENNPKLKDKLWYYFYNALLSRPITHLRNIGGNTAHLLYEASTMAVNPRNTRKVIRGVGKGFKEGLIEAKKILKREAEAETKFLEQRQRYEPKNLTLRNAMPTTWLSIEDAVFKKMFEGIEREFQAEILSKQYGDSITKTFDNMKAVIEGKELDTPEKLQNYISAIEEIQDFGKYGTFQKELGSMGMKFQDFIESTPFGAGKLVVPFIRTPANIMKAGLQPAKILKFASKEYREKFNSMSKRQQGHELRRMIAGTLSFSAIAGLLGSGVIEVTGQGATNKSKQDYLESIGYKPNMIYVKIGDEKIGVNYQNINPFNVILGILGNYSDSRKYNFKPQDDTSWDEQISKSLAGFLQTTTDQSFLQGASNFFEWMGGRNPNYLRKLPTMLIPGALSIPKDVMQYLPDRDKNRYKSESFTDDVKNRMGITDGLKVSRNVFGEAEETRTGILMPTKIKENELARYLLDNNINIPYPDRNLKAPNGEELNKDQYDDYVRISGEKIKQELIKNFDLLKGLSAENATREIRYRITDPVREETYEELFGKKTKKGKYKYVLPTNKEKTSSGYL